jgi:F420-non-reducing hydrogenase small subunit
MSNVVHLPVARTHEPRIVAFFCNWCTYTASDLAGTARLAYPPNTRVIRIMCSGRLDPQFVLTALRRGADGVLIGGCHPGDCHYQAGNYKCLKRYKLLKKYLAQLGVEDERVRLEWIAASEGDKVQRVTREMTEQLRKLGPLRLPPIPEPKVAQSGNASPRREPSPGGKPKVGFYWCASCGGCEESVVDLAEDLLDVVGQVDFVFFPVAMDFKRKDVEAMADGEMAVCFINGAIRSSEQREMAELLRKKSQIVIAYGSCSQLGGIPGLSNQCNHADMLKYVYEGSPTVDNPRGVRPEPRHKAPEGEVELPTLDESVKALHQTVPVDYTIPGCAPPTQLLKNALANILAGNLPPRGSVLAPDIAQCHECPRIDTKPENIAITEFKRPHEVEVDPDQCLLAQGLLCMGPATRAGCDSACMKANMPCGGCLGPVSRSVDHGAAYISAVASLIGPDDEAGIDAAIATIPDPVGTFCRYGLPGTLMHQAMPRTSNKEGA